MSMRIEPEFGDDSQEYVGEDDFHDYDEDISHFKSDYDERDFDRDVDFDDFIDEYE